MGQDGTTDADVKMTITPGGEPMTKRHVGRAAGTGKLEAGLLFSSQHYGLLMVRVVS